MAIKPYNSRLLQLLKKYSFEHNNQTYKAVVTELLEGNSYLLLPSDHEDHVGFEDWTSLPKGYSLNLGIYAVDGIKAIAAFSSEENLFAWTKKVTRYISLPSKNILEICETNGIKRIVIDSNQPTMVVLQQ